MRFSKAAVTFFLTFFSIVTLLNLSSCRPDECEDEICAPCPSSRLIMTYLDSTGACIPEFHSSAVVHAIRKTAPFDTAYSYNFSDSCRVGFLIQDDVDYHLVGNNPAITDIIEIESFDFQEPLAVTNCCLCYPVQTANILLNGQPISVAFVTGEYENVPQVRTVN